MSVSENLKAAVAARNTDNIRGGLWSCIAVDMNMTGRFKESLAYVLENGISEAELYEADDGAPFATAASAENFSALGGLLRVNFSKKKLDALRTMGRTLYPPQNVAEEPKKNQPAGAAGASAHSTPVPRASAAGSSSRQRSGATRPRADSSRYTAGGAAVGAGIGAIAAAKLGAKIGGIIGGGVIGAVVGACIGAALAGSSGGSAGSESGSPHREV